MNYKSAIKFLSVGIFLILLIAPICTISADNIRIVGKVVTKGKRHRPVPGVMLIDTKLGVFLTETEEDGSFRVTCDPNTTISFQSMDIQPVTVEVAGRNSFTVEVESKEYELDEVLVTAKGNLRDSIRIEPGDVIQMGDKFYINAVMKIGKSEFASDKRLVAQAILYNYTKKNAYLMPPIVVDGRNYEITQRRMYDRLNKKNGLADSGDSIGMYERVIEKDSVVGHKRHKAYKIIYHDSISAEVGKKDFIRCDITYTIEDYNKICKSAVVNYVEGVINPLRFLEMPFAGNVVTDSMYYPKPELQMCETKGQINLKFAIGKTDLDTHNPQNQAELNKLRQQLNGIANTPGSAIKSFRIIGTSSPDGGYNQNLRLAQGRMETARKMVMGMISSNASYDVYSTSQANVAPWESVVYMMREDSLFNEAEQIASIIQKNESQDIQGQKIRVLPFYKSLLGQKYLPQLRKVEYEISYDIRRALTLNEIEAAYRENPNFLTKYEYFVLIRSTEDEALKEKYCRDALQVHPNFWMAANDLQAVLIKQKKSDDKLLEKFAKSRVHPSVIRNHVISLLEANRFSAADSIANYLRRNPENEMLLALVGVNNNRIQANYETIERSSAVNKVLMCLYMNRNEEALQACNELDMNDGFTHYLLATCYKRMQNDESAKESLRKAFELNPELEKDAQIDGDLRKLYKSIKEGN